MTMKIYNGNNIILGRLASLAAKDVLLGEEVAIVNCENVLISGNKARTFEVQRNRYDRRGYPLKSPNLSRTPDRFVRRAIRGMLPWKISRGKEAYRHILCYRGIPESFQGKEMIAPIKESSAKLPTLKMITVGNLCKQLGGK